MRLLDIIQQFLTKPVELLMEVIYASGIPVSADSGILIILLSVLITVPSILLLRRVDLLQMHAACEKRKTSGDAVRLSGFASIIDKVSVSLLLEILLFAASYLFFTNPHRIWGGAFLGIQNLGQPDGLLKIGAVRVNLLPVCSFAVRIISDMIRFKKRGWGIRIHYLLAALLFFGLSYASLSGFALYRLVSESLRLLFCFYRKKQRALFPAAGSRQDHVLFALNAIYLVILTGVQIPSSVIRSAPTDFINAADYHSPLLYVLSTFLMAAGTFIFWFGIIYTVISSRAKRIMSFALTVLSVWGTINSMFFGNDRGVMSVHLQYDNMPADTLKDILFNCGILVLMALLLFLIWRRKTDILNLLILTLCLTKAVSSIVNFAEIINILRVERANYAERSAELPEIRLSTQGKNVVFLMLDRSIGYFVPFIMSERPELAEKFDGFTFYPNTLSFGTHTNEAAPALFGGYEYVPSEINARSEVSLADKHDEALRLLPVLFDEAGYEVTVLDPPYAGYLTLSDLSIFKDHPDIRSLRASGMFPSPLKKTDFDVQMMRRNFFCFSIYRIAPLILQPVIYAGGSYNQMNLNQAVNSLYSSQGVQDSFIREYSVLQNLPSITKFMDEDKNTYLSLANKTSHEAALLQLPDYIPSETVNNTGLESSPITRTAADGRTIELDNILKVSHYHVNMASFLLIGEWLDYLRANHVYDNTRIIIAADHGFPLGFTELEFDHELSEEVLTYNPVLMVKDFKEAGFKTDERFMTNAEVPLIALDGLVEDPVNPASGNPLESKAGTGSDFLIMHSDVWDIRTNNGNTFLPGRWFRFSGSNIFDWNSWTFLDTH